MQGGIKSLKTQIASANTLRSRDFSPLIQRELELVLKAAQFSNLFRPSFKCFSANPITSAQVQWPRCRITLCDRARQNCPIFPGAEPIQLGFDDDPAEAPPESHLKMFARVHDEILQRLRLFSAYTKNTWIGLADLSHINLHSDVHASVRLLEYHAVCNEERLWIYTLHIESSLGELLDGNLAWKRRFQRKATRTSSHVRDGLMLM